MTGRRTGCEGGATGRAGRTGRGVGAALVVALATALAGATGGVAAQASGEASGGGTAGSARAAAVVDRAVALMGGPALTGVRRVRLDMMTQWQRTGYRSVPWSDRPSFEPHVDVRDYTIPAWRNTRDFGARKIVNVVRDTVAVTDFGQGFGPQSVAYVDERDELFLYTPDRLVLLLRDAADLRVAGDTVLGGEPHTLVRATARGTLPVTVAFHDGTGLPTFLRFRQGHPNDFGLVPFGEMAVAVWYSNWRTFDGVAIPTQWDIERAGAPYKRMTVQRAVFDPDFAADSFAVADPLRAEFLASRKPMHDRPVDSATVAAPGLVQVHGFGFPAGAVRIGAGWALLEAGHAPLSLERGREALAGRGVARIDAAVVVAARNGNGGVARLVEEGVPVYTSRAGEPFVDVMLEGAGVRRRGVTVVSEGRWLGQGAERIRLEPLDLPDVPGSLVVYSPSRRWLWAPDAATALDVRIVLDRAGARGWSVEGLGTARGVWEPVDAGWWRAGGP